MPPRPDDLTMHGSPGGTMLNVLLESKAKRQRSAWGVATSTVLHAGIVALAVAATMKVGDAAPPETPDKPIIYVATPVPPTPAMRTPQTASGPSIASQAALPE